MNRQRWEKEVSKNAMIEIYTLTLAKVCTLLVCLTFARVAEELPFI
jgi:hypothetical protein